VSGKSQTIRNAAVPDNGYLDLAIYEEDQPQFDVYGFEIDDKKNLWDDPPSLADFGAVIEGNNVALAQIYADPDDTDHDGTIERSVKFVVEDATDLSHRPASQQAILPYTVDLSFD